MTVPDWARALMCLIGCASGWGVVWALRKAAGL